MPWNKYHARSGQSLQAWEASGWIRPQDPRGWFQWYCRFYLGRRTPDDARQVLHAPRASGWRTVLINRRRRPHAPLCPVPAQVARWLGVAGPRGRWLRNLVNQCRRHGGDAAFGDAAVAPTIRQLLLHWAYDPAAAELEAHARALGI